VWMIVNATNAPRIDATPSGAAILALVGPPFARGISTSDPAPKPNADLPADQPTHSCHATQAAALGRPSGRKMIHDHADGFARRGITFWASPSVRARA
jgi:hypothetical protein